MDHLAKLRRKAGAGRAAPPAIISALAELGVPGVAAAAQLGVTPPLISQWRSGIQPLPQKYVPALIELAHQARAVLQASAHNGANKIKIARAAGFLAEAEAEQS